MHPAQFVYYRRPFTMRTMPFTTQMPPKNATMSDHTSFVTLCLAALFDFPAPLRTTTFTFHRLALSSRGRAAY